jgi:hypothetical protein
MDCCFFITEEGSTQHMPKDKALTRAGMVLRWDSADESFHIGLLLLLQEGDGSDLSMKEKADGIDLCVTEGGWKQNTVGYISLKDVIVLLLKAAGWFKRLR